MLRQALHRVKPPRLSKFLRAFSRSSAIVDEGTSSSPDILSAKRKYTFKDARHARSVIRGASSEPSDSARFSECLDNALDPLRFSNEIARRVLTHSSHPRAVDGHNARFSFIGRRVLDAYFNMFLHSSKALTPTHDLALIAKRVIAAPVLGTHVAPAWELGKVLRWSPATKMRQARVESLQSVGLYKVHGEAVQAVMGAVFHEFGGVVAHRVFHTRILPRLLLPGSSGGLPEVFHDEALQFCEAMDGTEGSLLLSSSTSPPSEKTRKDVLTLTPTSSL